MATWLFMEQKASRIDSKLCTLQLHTTISITSTGKSEYLIPLLILRTAKCIKFFLITSNTFIDLTALQTLGKCIHRKPLKTRKLCLFRNGTHPYLLYKLSSGMCKLTRLAHHKDWRLHVFTQTRKCHGL